METRVSLGNVLPTSLKLKIGVKQSCILNPNLVGMLSSSVLYHAFHDDEIIYHCQARNQLGTPGGAKSLLRGVQHFKLCPIVLNYVQHIFPAGAKNILGGPAPPLVTGLITAKDFKTRTEGRLFKLPRLRTKGQQLEQSGFYIQRLVS